MIEKDNVMCGTMVIVKEDFTPVCNWLLGRVVEVYHGSDGKIQATLFVENFTSNNIIHEPLPLDFFTQDNSLINKPFHISELNRAIKSAKNTTPGEDQMPAKFLKLLNHSERTIILNFFQQLFDKAIVPKEWKHAIILPIPKPCKDKTKISSYRPIALTSVFSKTFERILSNRIAHFLVKEQKLHQQHYGFVPFKDNRTATYIIYKAITDAKMEKKKFRGD
ncbi:RNA-directed DNA polymerase from mobile element jockey [Trichonephila clavipes]|nr:RNA-directed DNA polymerase from mobile element jockey [Trichonephila clavipes]